jgi:hypothetical protein
MSLKGGYLNPKWNIYIQATNNISANGGKPMKKIVSAALVGVLAITTASVAVSAKTNKNFIARPTKGVTLDGDIKEFLNPAPAGDETLLVNTKVSKLEQGEIDDDKDYSLKGYALYDADNLYFAFDVTDESIQGPASAAEIYKNDCI